MCETAPSFLIEFNRKVNIHLSRNRRPWKHLPKCWEPELDDGHVKIYFSSLTQKTIKGGGPWGFDGLEWLSSDQSAAMDRIVNLLETSDHPTFFGMDGDRFFIVIKDNRADAMLLKLSI